MQLRQRTIQFLPRQIPELPSFSPLRFMTAETKEKVCLICIDVTGQLGAQTDGQGWRISPNGNPKEEARHVPRPPFLPPEPQSQDN